VRTRVFARALLLLLFKTTVVGKMVVCP